MGACKVAGKMHKRGPERIAWGGMCNRDRHGPVPASEITLSGSGRCSGRGRAHGGITHQHDCTCGRVSGDAATGTATDRFTQVN